MTRSAHRSTGWWSGRSPRERVLLLAGLLVALGAVAFRYGWQSLDAARRQALAEYSALDRVIARLQAAGPLSAVAAPVVATGAPLPLAAEVTDVAATAGLTIERLEPEGVGVRLVLGATDLETLLPWLAALEEGHGLTVAALALDRAGDPDQIAATVTLVRRADLPTAGAMP